MMPKAEDPGSEDKCNLDVEPGLDNPARGAEQLHQGQGHNAADQDLPGGLDPEMDEPPPPPKQVSRHVADGWKRDQIEQDERYQVDHQYGDDPGGLACGDRGSYHVVRKYHHDYDDAEGRPTGRFDILSALVDQP